MESYGVHPPNLKNIQSTVTVVDYLNTHNYRTSSTAFRILFSKTSLLNTEEKDLGGLSVFYLHRAIDLGLNLAVYLLLLWSNCQ